MLRPTKSLEARVTVSTIRPGVSPQSAPPGMRPAEVPPAALPVDRSEIAEVSATSLSVWQKVGLAGLGLVSLAGALAVIGPTGGPVARATPSGPRTALQKHVDYFDRDGNGKIRLRETYDGLRALGLGRGRAAFAATAINAGLGSTTGSPWHSFLTIDATNIHMGKHGSDTGIYDAQGEFVPEAYERMFTEYDKDGDQALDTAEMEGMLAGNRTESGATASRLEFEMLMDLAGEDRGAERVVTHDRLQALYDGSLFYDLAGEAVP